MIVVDVEVPTLDQPETSVAPGDVPADTSYSSRPDAAVLDVQLAEIYRAWAYAKGERWCDKDSIRGYHCLVAGVIGYTDIEVVRL